MMNEALLKGRSLGLIAGALAIVNQGAWSEQAPIAGIVLPEVTVTVPRQQVEIVVPGVEIDMKEHFEALGRRLANELGRNIDAIGAPRIELAVTEVPTRG